MALYGFDRCKSKTEITPDKIGAISRNGTSVTKDLDAILKSGIHFGFYEFNASTLGTPAKQGITSYSTGVVLSCSQNSSGNTGIQFAWVNGQPQRLIYGRNLTNGTISEWTVPFIPQTGGTATGAISVDSTGYLGFSKRRVIDEVAYKFLISLSKFTDVGVAPVLELTDDDGNSIQRITFPSLANGGPYIKENGVNYPIYTSANPPTAEEVGALPNTGGTLGGTLIVDSPQGEIHIKNNSENGNTNTVKLIQYGEGAYLRSNKDATGDYADLIVKTDADSPFYQTRKDNVFSSYKLYGEHNYPVVDLTQHTTDLTGTKLPTLNTMRHVLNRTTSCQSTDVNYTTTMARGIALYTSAPSAMNNGTVAFIYE